MKTTEKGFGLLTAILIIAALTAGGYAAVKINDEVKIEHQNEEMNSTSTIDASSSVKIGF